MLFLVDLNFHHWNTVELSKCQLDTDLILTGALNNFCLQRKALKEKKSINIKQI